MSPQQLACVLGLSAVLPHGLISLELQTRLWGEEKSLGLFLKKKPSLGGRPHKKPGDQDNPNARNC